MQPIISMQQAWGEVALFAPLQIWRDKKAKPQDNVAGLYKTHDFMLEVGVLSAIWCSDYALPYFLPAGQTSQDSAFLVGMR